MADQPISDNDRRQVRCLFCSAQQPRSVNQCRRPAETLPLQVLFSMTLPPVPAACEPSSMPLPPPLLPPQALQRR